MRHNERIDIVTIGGGGGHSTILRGLKQLSGVRITAICPSTDSGGSTGQLSRDYQGLGFLGDLTKCIASLCPDDDMASSLLYRFEHGVLAGHSVKNVLLLGMGKAVGISKALDMMYTVAGITPHRVIPVTTRTTELRARLHLGNEIRGETNIDLIAKNPLWHPDAHAIEEVFLRPRVRADAATLTAIRRARMFIVSPGDLYSSVLPVLLPVGVRHAVRTSSAHIVVVLNIMTKVGETQWYKAEDFLKLIERYLGRPADTILYNTAPIPRDARLAYALEHKVRLDSPLLQADARVCAVPLLRRTGAGELYHDAAAVAEQIRLLLKLK